MPPESYANPETSHACRDLERLCKAVSGKGVRCKAPRLTDSDWCWFHDDRPEVAAKRAVARNEKGARRKAIPELDLESEGGLRAFKLELLEGLRRGELGAADVRCALDLAEQLVEGERREEPGMAMDGLLAAFRESLAGGEARSALARAPETARPQGDGAIRNGSAS